MRRDRYAIALIVCLAGCSAGGSQWDIPARESTAFISGEIGDPATPFASAEETTVTVNPAVPGYALPLDLVDVANLDRDVREKEIHAVGEAAAAKLSQNGFVVVPMGSPSKRFSTAYQQLTHRGVPAFVTADSVLHLYHLFFDQVLKYLEVTEFSPTLSQLIERLVAASLAQHRTLDGTLKEAARRNVAYLSVAGRLLEPAFPVPAEAGEALEELALIERTEGLAASPLMNHDCPVGCDPCSVTPANVNCQAAGACTCEDYTQYTPRGHYTVSEQLERYFKAMIWLGRIGFRIRSDMETIQAVLLTDALNTATVDGVPVAKLWSRIYDVTGFLVGASDDLTFFEYQQAAQTALGDAFDLAELSRPERLAALKGELEKLRDPEILGGFLSVFLEETEQTKGWRFMGQRFAPDSYVLGQMVWDHVGPNISDPRAAPLLESCERPEATCAEMLDELALSNCFCFQAKDVAPDLCRLMPKGLDVMAVLGSEQAEADLAADRAYCGFSEQLVALQGEFSAYDRDDWRQSVYWYWLDALTPLLQRFPQGYPNWMRTEAWATKEQNTALTSWAQLRHDTILYVKQSYTPASAGVVSHPPEMFGTVEPVPRFFARLKDLTVYTRAGLERHQALPEDLTFHLDHLTSLLGSLTNIATKHLENRELDRAEIDTIKHIGDRFHALITGLAAAVTVEQPPSAECEARPEFCGQSRAVQGDDPYKTTIVADVHTDVNTETVLEEGSGFLDWLIVARQLPDGTVGVSVGPVFSYYEFAHPMADRLTDEKWNGLLASDPPARPAWIQRIRVQ